MGEVFYTFGEEAIKAAGINTTDFPYKRFEVIEHNRTGAKHIYAVEKGEKERKRTVNQFSDRVVEEWGHNPKARVEYLKNPEEWDRRAYLQENAPELLAAEVDKASYEELAKINEQLLQQKQELTSENAKLRAHNESLVEQISDMRQELNQVFSAMSKLSGKSVEELKQGIDEPEEAETRNEESIDLEAELANLQSELGVLAVSDLEEIRRHANERIEAGSEELATTLQYVENGEKDETRARFKKRKRYEAIRHFLHHNLSDEEKEQLPEDAEDKILRILEINDEISPEERAVIARQAEAQEQEKQNRRRKAAVFLEEVFESDRRRSAFAAIGAVALGAAAFAAGYYLHKTGHGGNQAPDADSLKGQIASLKAEVHQALSQLKDIKESLRNRVGASGSRSAYANYGDGYTQILKKEFPGHSAASYYHAYRAATAQYGPNFIRGVGHYRMSNGDWGLMHAGPVRVTKGAYDFLSSYFR